MSCNGGLDSPLGDGCRVEVRVVTWQGRDVIKAPGSALFRQGEGWAVLRVRDRRAELRPVEVGHRGEHEAEIRSGLAVGDQVIVHPPEDLEPGAKVKPRDQARAGPRQAQHAFRGNRLRRKAPIPDSGEDRGTPSYRAARRMVRPRTTTTSPLAVGEHHSGRAARSAAAASGRPFERSST